MFGMWIWNSLGWRREGGGRWSDRVRRGLRGVLNDLRLCTLGMEVGDVIGVIWGKWIVARVESNPCLWLYNGFVCTQHSLATETKRFFVPLRWNIRHKFLFPILLPLLIPLTFPNPNPNPRLQSQR